MAGSNAPASSRPTRSRSWSPTRYARGPARGSRWSCPRAPTMRASSPPANASRGSPGAASRSACSATTGRRSSRLDAAEEVGREARHLVAVVVERHHVPAPLEHVALDQARPEAPAHPLQVGERYAVVVAPVEEERRLRDPSDLAPHDGLEPQQLEHRAERHGTVAAARGTHRGVRDVRPAGLGDGRPAARDAWDAREERQPAHTGAAQDRKSTRLNSSHLVISYAVFCLKKKKK